MEQPGSEGWRPPKTDEEIWRWFSTKHGDDSYTQALHRKWSKMGKLIASGAKIRDGYLGR